MIFVFLPRKLLVIVNEMRRARFSENVKTQKNLKNI